ncbi:MAG TPA: hypothetical protein VNT42_11485 [Sphingomonas sp.]|nr:hypothetical protein [Sphingomonas sp.]
MKRFGLILLGALAPSATAKPVEFSAIVKGELGYGTNPFLRSGVTKGAALASGTVMPRLTYQTALATTTLSGSYTRDEYLNSFGHTESLTASLTRQDQLAQNLTSQLAASFTSTNRAIITDPTQTLIEDPLNIGRRTRHLNGSYQIQWQASGRDQFSFGGSASHLSYGGNRTTLPGRASGYDQYGANGSYYRTIDARTSVGAAVSVTSVHSRLYPNSRSIQPSITAKRQLSGIWTVDGHVGLVFQTIYGPFGESRTSLGFGLNLCGKYPLTSFCVTADRGSQPSGYGGLRTSTSIAANLTHSISEHDRASFNASYVKSDSIGSATITGPSFRNSRAILANAEYDRDLTQRLSGGVGARYQWRDLTSVGTAHAISATVHVTAKLGRI